MALTRWWRLSLLRNLIANNFAANVPVFELASGRTVRSVADLVEDCSHVGFEGKKLSNGVKYLGRSAVA